MKLPRFDPEKIKVRKGEPPKPGLIERAVSKLRLRRKAHEDDCA